MEDHLETIMDMAMEQGCSYVEARYQADDYETNLLKNGEPEVSSFGSDRGIGIRVLVDGALGFGATNRITRRELRSLVSRTVSYARRSSPMRGEPISMARAEMGQGRVEIPTRVPFDAVDNRSRIALLKEADREAQEAAAENGAKLPGRFFSLDTLTTEKMVVNSDGGKVHSIIPRVALDMFMTASSERGSMQRIMSLGESSGWEGVERWDIPDKAGKEVGRLSRILNLSRPMKGTQCDLVLGPEVVGIVSHESSGHPGEADRILGREAAQAGETYLDRESIGRRVGSEVVNVVEDPTLPRSFGFYKYDDEGVKARRRYLIREGKVHEFLHNRETAETMGVESNGSSRSVSFDKEPIVRMSNTFVEPGGHSLEELLEDIREGIYINNFMEWNIDDRRYNQRYVGLEAYEIRDGELGELVRNPALEITTVGLWSAVDAVGKDLEFKSGYCGKGDPMQPIPVWMGGPPIRLRNVRLGGSS